VPASWSSSEDLSSVLCPRLSSLPLLPASPPCSLATSSRGLGPGPSILSGFLPRSSPAPLSSTLVLASAWPWWADGFEGSRTSFWFLVLSSLSVEDPLTSDGLSSGLGLGLGFGSRSLFGSMTLAASTGWVPASSGTVYFACASSGSGAGRFSNVAGRGKSGL